MLERFRKCKVIERLFEAQLLCLIFNNMFPVEAPLRPVTKPWTDAIVAAPQVYGDQKDQTKPTLVILLMTCREWY